MRRKILISTTFAGAALFALLINAVIFIGIPFLSAATAGKPNDLPDSFVTFDISKPVVKQEQRRPEKQQEEKKPEKLPEMKMKHAPQKQTTPKMNISMPNMNFALNDSLSSGMAVSMPVESGGGGQIKMEFDIGEVDTPPQVLYRTEPVYPFAAKRRQVTGKVVLKFLVDEKGEIGKVSIVSATPKGVFEESVMSAIKRWRFKPGIYEKQPVRTWVVAPFEFRM